MSSNLYVAYRRCLSHWCVRSVYLHCPQAKQVAAWLQNFYPALLGEALPHRARMLLVLLAVRTFSEKSRLSCQKLRQNRQFSLNISLAQTPRKRKTRHSQNPPVESHVGWVMDSKEHRPSRHRTTSTNSSNLGERYRQSFLFVLDLHSLLHG